MFEGVPINLVALVISAAGGGTGVAFIFWYVDQRRMQRKDEDHAKEIAAKDESHRKEFATIIEQITKNRETNAKEVRDILDSYREDVRKVSRFYEDNVNLVRAYERRDAEQTDTLRLNIAAVQELTTFLKSRRPCYELIQQWFPKLAAGERG